jgi:hypothetical protein
MLKVIAIAVVMLSACAVEPAGAPTPAPAKAPHWQTDCDPDPATGQCPAPNGGGGDTWDVACGGVAGESCNSDWTCQITCHGAGQCVGQFTDPNGSHPGWCVSTLGVAPTVDTVEHQCVLCGEDPGGGDGGGGIVSTTENWLDANYPGWSWLGSGWSWLGSGSVDCRVTADGNDCSALFQWGGSWIDAGCVLLGDGTHVCG